MSLKNLERLFLVLLLVTAFGLSACGKKDSTNESSGDNKESTESGEDKESDDNESSGDVDMSSGEFSITYEMEGPETKGTMTMYKMGDMFKTEMKGDFAGQGEGTASAIYKDDYVYTVMDMAGIRQGIKIKVDEYEKDNENFDINDIEEQLDKYKIVGTETILGKECDVYDTGEGTKMSVYDKKAVLKVVSKDMTMVATQFDTSPGLSSSDFDVPEDVEFIDMEEMLKGMKNLKNLEKLEKLDPSKK